MKPSSDDKDVKKYLGAFSIVDAAAIVHAEVKRAILRTPTELVVEYEHEGIINTISLRRRADGEFHGALLQTHPDDDLSDINVSCRLFETDSGLFVFGRWTDASHPFAWWAVLERVTRFPDERAPE